MNVGMIAQIGPCRESLRALGTLIVFSSINDVADVVAVATVSVHVIGQFRRSAECLITFTALVHLHFLLRSSLSCFILSTAIVYLPFYFESKTFFFCTNFLPFFLHTHDAQMVEWISESDFK